MVATVVVMVVVLSKSQGAPLTVRCNGTIACLFDTTRVLYNTYIYIYIGDTNVEGYW